MKCGYACSNQRFQPEFIRRRCVARALHARAGVGLPAGPGYRNNLLKLINVFDGEPVFNRFEPYQAGNSLLAGGGLSSNGKV